MDELRLAHYRGILEALRSEIEDSLGSPDDQTRPVEPDRAIGRLTRQDAILSQSMAIELRRRNQQRLLAVEQALRRIAEGEYGECARCGDEIGAARLQVRPESPLCVACAGGGGTPKL